MFRRLAPRLCAKVPQQAAAAVAAASSAANSANAPIGSGPSASPPNPVSNSAAQRKKSRSFEAVDEEPAATVAPDASAFPPPPNPYESIRNGSSSSLPNDDDPKLSPEARRKIEIMKEIGDEAFDENTRVLKNMALRGMRSGLIIVVGVVAFMVSLKRKKARDAAFDQEEAERKAAEAAKDPTQRYLEEMSSIGFDVEQGEIDAAEARKKHAAAASKKR